ncbi:Histone-lysine N-methyltransferase SETD2 [Toxocara canis]|uniref:[histone H3]-lysine(36) N-trimethyltransferase n=1 Tax=Toxocara canis TaxID=6265 RepID=A0A0B2VQZ8_TOXCA|nr:Histone-lysine N-methyltransferase SETD2 [Toxocara canis]
MSIKLMKQRWLSEVHEADTENNSSTLNESKESSDEQNDSSSGVIDMELDDDYPSPVSAPTQENEKGQEVVAANATQSEPVAEEKEEVKEQAEEPSAPPPFVLIEENVILCDESLIKEAAVVRCFCEPTEQELSAGSGCGENCINRMLYTECGSRCPSGTRCSNRRLHNKEYAKVEVFYAGIKGWGLRACEPLEPGRFIMEYVGEVISAEEMRRRGRRYGRDPKHVHHYLMALKNGAVIDATVRGNISRFINHSCDPNCRSEKWTVDRRVRIGFFAIKKIAIGEELVFDYQLELYGRKAQRCYCGAANCRGLIGGDSESDGEEQAVEGRVEADDFEDSGSEEEAPVAEKKVVVVKSKKKATSSRRAKKTTYKKTPNEEAINEMLVRGAPRNRMQVKELVQLMIQVEQANQRCALLRCFEAASSDILRLFMEECGLRLLYIFLASEYPIDDQGASLGLYVKTLDVLSLMPITTRNQVVDSHLIVTLGRLILKKGPIDGEVTKKVQVLVDAVCADTTPSTSESPTPPLIICDTGLEKLHHEMINKANYLLAKWKDLREEFRIPRRERSDTPMSEQERADDDDKMQRRSVIPEKKVEAISFRNHRIMLPRSSNNFNKRVQPKKKHSMTPPPCADLGAPPTRRSRFDVVGDGTPGGFGSSFEGGMEELEPNMPPPPMLLPESMFSAGFSDFNGFPSMPMPYEGYSWEAAYANGYDPSSAAFYQQYMAFYQQQHMQIAQQTPTKMETLSILDAPSPPAEPMPNTITLGPYNMDNPTDEDIEALEKQLALMKEKRAANKKKEAEAQGGIPPPPPPEPQNKKSKWLMFDGFNLLQQLALMKEKRAANKKKEAEAQGGIPPPPPPEPQNKKSKWVQATTEEGTVYYYNKETRPVFYSPLETVWHLPEEGDEAADTTSDQSDPRAVFKALIAKHVAGILEPIRKTKFSSSDDYKYVLRKLTHTVLEKETKRVGGGELKVTDSVKEKARRYVTDYIARLGEGNYSRKNKQHNTY